MKQRLTGCVISTLALALAIAPPAGAAITPRGNPAVTQYTESFPTVRGPRQSNKAVDNRRSPSTVLGQGNARRLAALGSAGQAAAEAAAATAPSPASPSRNGSKNRTGKGAAGEGVSSGSEAGDGSSGLGEVLGEATGISSSGQLGPALPLIVLAAFAASFAYLWRRTRHAP